MSNSRAKAKAPRSHPPAVEAVWFTQTTLTFDLRDGRSISVPLSFYPALFAAPESARLQHEIHGPSVYWSELRLKLSATDLLSGKKKG